MFAQSAAIVQVFSCQGFKSKCSLSKKDTHLQQQCKISALCCPLCTGLLCASVARLFRSHPKLSAFWAELRIQSKRNSRIIHLGPVITELLLDSTIPSGIAPTTGGRVLFINFNPSNFNRLEDRAKFYNGYGVQHKLEHRAKFCNGYGVKHNLEHRAKC
jgi:hypothetical protein